MIYDWLNNREFFFPMGILYKTDVFLGGGRWEKRYDVHTEDQRIRKKVSPRTKASLTKASLSEKLSKEDCTSQIPQ